MRFHATSIKALVNFVYNENHVDALRGQRNPKFRHKSESRLIFDRAGSIPHRYVPVAHR